MQRWVRAFRRDFTLVAHTNNGVEAQNRAFKFEYMMPYRRKSLSNLLVCIVKGFLPDAYRKYVGVLTLSNSYGRPPRSWPTAIIFYC